MKSGLPWGQSTLPGILSMAKTCLEHLGDENQVPRGSSWFNNISYQISDVKSSSIYVLLEAVHSYRNMHT
jgi:hypothetical protein